MLPGTPVSATGEALLAPLRNGSRLRYNATVKVNLPLVGGAGGARTRDQRITKSYDLTTPIAAYSHCATSGLAISKLR